MKNNKLSLIFIILVSGITFGFSSANASFGHSLWDQVMKKQSSQESFDFMEVKNEYALLNEYLESFKQVSLDDVYSWSREDQIAFWINGFNALIVKAVVDHDLEVVPRISDENFPTDILLSIKGNQYSPLQIRDEILRAQYRDERTYLALFDGAINSPRIRPEAYVGDQLDFQLNDEIKFFLNDQIKNKINLGKKKLILSYVFKDFADDFILNYGRYSGKRRNISIAEMAVLSFIADYSSEEIVEYLRDLKFKIKYSERDGRVRL